MSSSTPRTSTCDPGMRGRRELRDDEREQRKRGKARAMFDLQRRHDTALGREWRNSNESRRCARGFRAHSRTRSTLVGARSARVQIPGRRAIGIEAALGDPQRAIVAEIVSTVEQRVP